MIKFSPELPLFCEEPLTLKYKPWAFFPHFVSLFFPLQSPLSVSLILLKEGITLQMQFLSCQQSLCYLPNLLQKFIGEIRQDIIILD